MTARKNSITITTHHEDQTIAFAASLAQIIKPQTIIALFGDLGAGKTRFVRGLAKGLSLNENEVSSPTFVIMHEYQPDNTSSQSPTLIHIDAYRLTGLDDLQTIGWDELLHKKNTIIIIEWAERIAEALPDDRINIEIQHAGNNDRQITITPTGRIRMNIQDKQWDSIVKQVDTQDVNNIKSKSIAIKEHICPICKKKSPTDSPSFPFCSKRCRLLDLSKWLNGEYTLSRNFIPEDESDLQ